MWQKVAKVSDLEEGKGTIVVAAGREVALFKLQGGVRALDNICPHQGGPLGEGALDGETVICPWHAWSFNTRTGECDMASDIKQAVFKVRIDGEDVMVDV